MTRIVRLLVLLIVLAAGAFGAIVYLAQMTAPPSQPVEKVLPDGDFPR